LRDRNQQSSSRSRQLEAPVGLKLGCRRRARRDSVECLARRLDLIPATPARQNVDGLPESSRGCKIVGGYFRRRSRQARRHQPPGQISGCRKQLTRRGAKPCLQGGGKIDGVVTASKTETISIFWSLFETHVTYLTGFGADGKMLPL
jgi:hypothetical protein